MCCVTFACRISTRFLNPFSDTHTQVMTSVYGVTFVGARGQISARLIERGWEDNKHTYRVACYAAQVRFWLFE